MNVLRKLPFHLGCLAAALACGCYTAQLDPDLVGAFACDRDEDSPCPADTQVCVNARCEDAELVPTLAVVTPEDEQSFTRGDLDLMLGMPPEPVALDIVIQGSLELVSTSEDADPVIGQGHVKVFIDGEEHLTLDSGSILSAGELRVEVPPMAGPHRIVLQAYRNDGVAYDNPEATAARLFWFEHENELLQRPFVAIKSPWPNTVFDTDDQDLTIELAAVRFQFAQPGGPPRQGEGHAHVAHDPRMDYPECVKDPGCDAVYLPDGVVGASKTAEVVLPASDEGSDRLTAVLRTSDHEPYAVPFDCDPAGMDLPNVCTPVFDTIEIVRTDAD